MSKTIALVDDDQHILTSVSMALKEEGFDVLTFTDSVKALDSLTQRTVNLAILDINMPRMNGLELLKHLRERTRLPIIFLTSRDDEIDEILGLRLGADDYIKKPFSQKLLIERIHTLLRHQKFRETKEQHTASGPLRYGDLLLDETRHICSWKGHHIDLTVTEFLLILSLVSNPGHVKTRDQLIDAAYGEHIYVDDRTIDSHIKRLRRKFKEIDQDFSEIETLYGLGYRYRTQ